MERRYPTGPLPGVLPADRSRNVDAKRALARECYPRDHRDDDETVDRRRARITR